MAFAGDCKHGASRARTLGGPAPSSLQPIPRSENPPQRQQAGRDERRGEAEADSDADVAAAVEAPAKAADEIDDGIEQELQ